MPKASCGELKLYRVELDWFDATPLPTHDISPAECQVITVAACCEVRAVAQAVAYLSKWYTDMSFGNAFAEDGAFELSRCITTMTMPEVK